MVKLKEGVDLQERINVLLFQAAQGSDLKEVEAAADGLIQLGAELPAEQEALECLARESVGYSIARMAPAIRQQIMIELKEGNLVTDNGPVGAALESVMRNRPEIEALVQKFDVTKYDVKAGTFKVAYFQGLLAGVNKAMQAYMSSDTSTQSWVQSNLENYVLLDKLLGDIERLGAQNDVERCARGVQVNAVYPGILAINYAMLSESALAALKMFEADSDDRQRELLKDEVESGIDVLEGLAVKYSGKVNGEFAARIKNELDQHRNSREELAQKRLPEILEAQDTLYDAAKKAAKDGNEAAFNQAKTLYAVFTQAYQSALEEDQASFDKSIKDLNALYQEK
ncbi:MAG TPA: hypothetical protein VI612_01610 [Candidatus Nanoarchaeia archaeon]|nr:hypothetical protein [Candidatus Nanoarchaeia archaeon]